MIRHDRMANHGEDPVGYAFGKPGTLQISEKTGIVVPRKVSHFTEKLKPRKAEE
jgi:hypothetical protein